MSAYTFSNIQSWLLPRDAGFWCNSDVSEQAPHVRSLGFTGPVRRARGTSKVTHRGHGSRATCRFGVNLDAKSKCILAERQARIKDNQEKHQNDRSHDHGVNL